MPVIGFSQALLLVLATALLGGFIAKSLKFQPLVGYLVGGILLSVFLPQNQGLAKLAEVGTILLLFSVGLELPFSRISRVFKKVALGTILQLGATTVFFAWLFLHLGANRPEALLLAFGISLSSTALVLKILSDKGETDTLHGQIMAGWLLIQDLAVVPVLAFLPFWALLKAMLMLAAMIFLGRKIVPYLIHKVAQANSRELLLLSAICLAVGTAYLTGLMGVSLTLGAFLAGVVIAESAENHAIFAETRPLRDLFVAIFFVILGLAVNPRLALVNLPLILALAVTIIVVKVLINFGVGVACRLRGKPLVLVSLGLAQAGEFAFILFSQAAVLGIVSQKNLSVAVSASLLTLIATPFIFKHAHSIWRILKEKTRGKEKLGRLFRSGEKQIISENNFADHVIVCGYGRVGGWVGRALAAAKIPFVVVDFDQKVVTDLAKSGLPVIFGDPGEAEILEAAGIAQARVIVLAIPDRVSQENLISYVQTKYPAVKIISRVHQDEDWERLKLMRVFKIVQPEFEAALSIVKTIFISAGKPKEEIDGQIKKLRISHSLK